MKDCIETKLIAQCWCTWSMGINLDLGILLAILLTHIKPNTRIILGIIFMFVLTDKGIYPKGGPNYIQGGYQWGYPNRAFNALNTNCGLQQGAGSSGEGCAYWVLTNGNLNYWREMH